MLLQLVKKDFLIVKKYVLLMIAVCVVFPLFLIWRSPEYAGILGFVLITIFSIFMLLQYVSLKETQYPKASTLLCALPFSRKDIVLSKYIFCILIYFACSLIFGLETLLFPQLRNVGYELPALEIWTRPDIWTVCMCTGSFRGRGLLRRSAMLWKEDRKQKSLRPMLRLRPGHFLRPEAMR